MSEAALSSASPSIASTKNRLDFIEALRGWAALYVVVFHMVFLPNPQLLYPAWAVKFIAFGGSGVTLFFIVSAFTLTYAMRLREQEPHPVQRFYLRRIFRIAPLFYILIFVACLRYIFISHRPISLLEILLNLSFTFNFVPGYQPGLVWASWTIGVEMVFYLLFPLVYRFINSLPKAIGFFVVTLLISNLYSYLLFEYATFKNISFIIERSFLHQFPIFALGMVVFYIFEKFIHHRTISRWWGVGLLILSGVGFVALVYGFLKFLIDPLYWEAIVYSLLVLALAIFPFGLFVNRLFLLWGKLSYSLYLNHPLLVLTLLPIYPIIYAWPLPVAIKLGISFLLVLVLLTAISSITYRFIEAPGMKLGSKLIKKYEIIPQPEAKPLKFTKLQSGDDSQ